jgi:hypothetical protein
MPRALLALALAAALGGCRTFDPKHPATGRPDIDGQLAAWWAWFEGGAWHVRMTAGGRLHRFQGSIAGVSGGVVEWHPTSPGLKDQMALVGDAVQFDLELEGFIPAGLDVRMAGECARLDLYVDGHHRPERVRVGPRSLHPGKVPFERCP